MCNKTTSSSQTKALSYGGVPILQEDPFDPEKTCFLTALTDEELARGKKLGLSLCKIVNLVRGVGHFVFRLIP